jgi:hypothetical protein
MGRILLGNNLLLTGVIGSGLTIEWIGWDGTIWDLTSGEQGVVLLPGFQGFSMPEVQRYEREGPSVHGSYYTGFRVNSRKIFLPIKILTGASIGDIFQFTNIDSKFFDSLRPDVTGTLRVTTPGGGTREIECRFDTDNDATYDSDPTIDGWTVYGVNLVANDPFWTSDEIKKSYGSSSSDEDFYDRDDANEVHYLSPSGSFTEAQFRNPGDVEGYLTWTIKGPFDTISVGINGEDIKIPFAITGSQTITIDTSPKDMRIMRNGVNITTSLTTPPKYDVIPPQATVKIKIVATGTTLGLVTATLKPLYYRAW